MNESQEEMVDTTKVPDRRELDFSSIDQMMADIEQLAELERAGRLRSLGNWTLGQTLGHLASWAGYAFEGAPFKAPWFVKVFGRLMRKRMFYKPMRAGFHLPKVDGGTYGIERISLDEGLQGVTAAMNRVKNETPPLPSEVLGRMTLEEHVALNLRHAELHLSFFVPIE